jgi:uncharacterized protein (TIGR03086 family)
VVAAAPAAVLVEAPALLERAVGYTRTSLGLVTPDRMGAPTPCPAWDLRGLLRHMDDSLAAFTEAALGHVEPCAPLPAGPPAVVASVKARACALLAAWSAREHASAVSVAGRPVPSDLLAAAGALEVAVHGWDVARSCGRDRPLPDGLARALLAVAPLLVGDADRPDRFAAPRPVRTGASASVRLLGYLGRDAVT